jgi:hypothetical protein
MTAATFAQHAGLTTDRKIFEYKGGQVGIGCEDILSVFIHAVHHGVKSRDLVVTMLKKEDLELAESSRPRKLTGKKWTESSKQDLNSEFLKYPKLPKGLFSIEDIQDVLTERNRIKKLEPCMTATYLANWAHYHKGMSWAKARSYASWASCKCCEENQQED